MPFSAFILAALSDVGNGDRDRVEIDCRVIDVLVALSS